MQQRMLSNLLAISKSAPHFPWCNGQTYEYMSWVLVFQVCLPLYVSLSPRGGSDRAVSHAVYCPDPLCFLVILVYASSVFFHCDCVFAVIRNLLACLHSARSGWISSSLLPCLTALPHQLVSQRPLIGSSLITTATASIGFTAPLRGLSSALNLPLLCSIMQI